jgi:hypothetical protein
MLSSSSLVELMNSSAKVVVSAVRGMHLPAVFLCVHTAILFKQQNSVVRGTFSIFNSIATLHHCNMFILFSKLFSRGEVLFSELKEE